jgi:hypothetical protein
MLETFDRSKTNATPWLRICPSSATCSGCQPLV